MKPENAKKSWLNLFWSLKMQKILIEFILKPENAKKSWLHLFWSLKIPKNPDWVYFEAWKYKKSWLNLFWKPENTEKSWLNLFDSLKMPENADAPKMGSNWVSRAPVGSKMCSRWWPVRKSTRELLKIELRRRKMPKTFFPQVFSRICSRPVMLSVADCRVCSLDRSAPMKLHPWTPVFWGPAPRGTHCFPALLVAQRSPREFPVFLSELQIAHK